MLFHYDYQYLFKKYNYLKYIIKIFKKKKKNKFTKKKLK